MIYGIDGKASLRAAAVIAGRSKKVRSKDSMQRALEEEETPREKRGRGTEGGGGGVTTTHSWFWLRRHDNSPKQNLHPLL